MIKTYQLILLTAGAASLLTACSTATTTIMPMDNGTYQAITMAKNTSDAEQDAIKKATDTCQQQNKRLAVINTNTTYQGSGKELGDITEAMHQASFMNNGPFIPSSQTDNDYKTVTTFRCV